MTEKTKKELEADIKILNKEIVSLDKEINQLNVKNKALDKAQEKKEKSIFNAVEKDSLTNVGFNVKGIDLVCSTWDADANLRHTIEKKIFDWVMAEARR